MAAAAGPTEAAAAGGGSGTAARGHSPGGEGAGPAVRHQRNGRNYGSRRAVGREKPTTPSVHRAGGGEKQGARGLLGTGAGNFCQVTAVPSGGSPPP